MWEVETYRNKTLSVEECLNKNSTYLKDAIINLKKSDTWEIQSKMANHFMSFTDNDEDPLMRPKGMT